MVQIYTMVHDNTICEFMFHINYVIEGIGALVNPDEKHQYRNNGDVPFKMICGVPKEFE